VARVDAGALSAWAEAPPALSPPALRWVAAAITGLTVAAAVYVWTGGQEVTLLLAIALLGDPDALLLDEPTAALDPEQRQRLWERLELQRERGVALLFVTQHADELEHHAERVVALRDGAVAFAGPVAEYDVLAPAR